MSETAKIQIPEQQIELPIIRGNDGRGIIDIQQLAEKTGYYTYDQNLNNTAIGRSAITWIDSQHGHLLYRGYDVAELVEHSSFVEVSYLLSNGELPSASELDNYSRSLSKHSMIHESMRNIFDSFPGTANPLAILATMVTTLSSYYPDPYEENIKKGIDVRTRLLAKVRTLAAWAYKKSIGQPTIYPKDELPYCTNFLNMMFSVPAEPLIIREEDDRILNQLLILYSDHEHNVATSTVRLVASTRANLFACIAAGICTLWGTRESDANLPPVYMLQDMIDNHLSAEAYFDRFIKKGEVLKSNGLGHSAYEKEDPRASLARKLFHEYHKHHPAAAHDPMIEKALEVEEYVLGHPFFKELNLYPNLDYYSAMVFHLLGIPAEMNNVIRAMGKLSGWLAHWVEERHELDQLAYRPRQVYTGKMKRGYISVDQRS